MYIRIIYVHMYVHKHPICILLEAEPGKTSQRNIYIVQRLLVYCRTSSDLQM